MPIVTIDALFRPIYQCCVPVVNAVGGLYHPPQAPHTPKTSLHDLKSKKTADKAEFSSSDLEALNYVWDKFGHLDEWGIVDLTHKYPDWYKHGPSLKLADRIEMDVNDFFLDSTFKVDKCFPLTDEEKEIRRDQLEEMLTVESAWR